MTSSYEIEALVVAPPGTGGSISIGTGASSTATAGNLAAYAGKWLTFAATTPAHVRFGTASVGPATAGDIEIPAGTWTRMRIPKDGSRSYVRALAVSTSGTVYFRVTSGAY